MNKEKEKGVATSLVPSATCWPLALLVSRRHVFSVGTRPPSARVLRRHVFSVGTRLGAGFAFSAHTPTTTCALGAPYSLSSRGGVSPYAGTCSPHTHTDSNAARPLSSAYRPLLGRRIPSPPIGGETRLLPSASPVTVTGRFLYAPGGCTAVFLSCT